MLTGPVESPFTAATERTSNLSTFDKIVQRRSSCSGLADVRRSRHVTLRNVNNAASVQLCAAFLLLRLLRLLLPPPPPLSGARGENGGSLHHIHTARPPPLSRRSVDSPAARGSGEPGTFFFFFYPPFSSAKSPDSLLLSSASAATTEKKEGRKGKTTTWRSPRCSPITWYRGPQLDSIVSGFMCRVICQREGERQRPREEQPLDCKTVQMLADAVAAICAPAG
ncbi:hypothetical protein F2P81_021541 [Scophthalmus maximus]|uniref:Uncharacterized protein n=1 Tax=Scophthalmus maximus TaxID=52904 RepID=A0A6A4S856_SCOMX|nr:hypothetical protein F2P81_021541 [Scophthalmus maximus]